jgi:hypothetical protein
MAFRRIVEFSLNLSVLVVFGCVTVSVLVTGPKVHKLKRGRDDGILWTIKIRSTTSFAGEVKPSNPYRKNLRHVKSHFEV